MSIPDYPTIDCAMWRESFRLDAIPAFRCPSCGSGYVRPDKDSLFISKRKECSLAPNSYEYLQARWCRFRLKLTCDVSECSEVVEMIGDSCLDSADPSYYDDRVEIELFPKMIYPAPHIINAPDSMDAGCHPLLITSFELFWVDLSACLNSIRILIERMLDEFFVPSTQTTARSNPVELRDVKPINNLGERIELLGTKFPSLNSSDAHVKMSLFALQAITNSGSHGNYVSREAVLWAFEALDDCIQHIFVSEEDRERQRESKSDAYYRRMSFLSNRLINIANEAKNVTKKYERDRGITKPLQSK